MSLIRTETETVIKKILPYMERRGYDIDHDLDFETAISSSDRYRKGYIDILVTLGKKKPSFLIEAKKISKKLSQKDRDQAVGYGRSKDITVPFVVVTNGLDIYCFNTCNSKRILWDNKLIDKIPSKDQLGTVLRILKSNPGQLSIPISNDISLPFRPGLALRQLNALFYQCHSIIRKIEKNEESAFSDFSKILFLKLLEEKNDVENNFDLPYSYRFYELASKPISESDQIMDSILNMINIIKKNKIYGEVLDENIKLKNPKTFYNIIKILSSVSFYDCSLDSKGAAFEYFVRATLKGKKLGQYFTPRELVRVMFHLVGKEKILNALISGNSIKVLDPACGTGGFLVFLMQESIRQLSDKFKKRKIDDSTFHTYVKRIKENTFWGSDANEGVAASAKMNMIIAGDGHTNIRHEDSLSVKARNWNVLEPDVNLIMTNPPFGTSEGDSLSLDDMQQFHITGSKGQHLFIQKMIKTVLPGGEICTVIDEGVLNTESAAQLRKYILQNCKIIAVVNLPDETFKPNKINVKSSLLYLQKRSTTDAFFEDNYNISFIHFDSLGYHGSGDKIRGFDENLFLNEIGNCILEKDKGQRRSGYNWTAFDTSVQEIADDVTNRLDYKYWEIDIREKIDELKNSHNLTIRDLNLIPTSRGKSPTPDNYVDQIDGYALVVKAGSNINKFGKIVTEESDWIEKSLYDEFIENSDSNILQKGDVLLSSTGDGTLGKCCVFDLDIPAIADGHVTIIRPDTSKIDNYYLADYLRNGFGAIQISRLYTGSTGLIELTPDQVDSIIIDLLNGKVEQKRRSQELRTLEKDYLEQMNKALEILNKTKIYLNI
jgi:type I restriction enzyme M protein